ncbi:hypothetical protein STEG23_007643, partial [Scotinomys teguina]
MAAGHRKPSPDIAQCRVSGNVGHKSLRPDAWLSKISSNLWVGFNFNSLIATIAVEKLYIYLRYWAFTGTLLGHPAVVLCHGDVVALDLQYWSLNLLQQIIDKLDVR